MQIICHLPLTDGTRRETVIIAVNLPTMLVPDKDKWELDLEIPIGDQTMRVQWEPQTVSICGRPGGQGYVIFRAWPAVVRSKNIDQYIESLKLSYEDASSWDIV